MTVQALRFDRDGEATRRLVARLSSPLRAAGVLEIPMLVSLDDGRDAVVVVGFADRAAADADRVTLARAALSKALAALGITTRSLERYTERMGGGSAADSSRFRLAIGEADDEALRDFTDRSARHAATPTELVFLWLGRADGSEGALALAGYADEASVRSDIAIAALSAAARRELGVRVYASQSRPSGE